ncbi:MAG: twin-arginine translocase TatA/TatE family subunit [Candidatus Paceibacterota bacterium]|jgi:sec-independent protein translocase protein TatA
MLGLTEIIIIIVIAAIILLGGKKIPEIARALGRFSGEFKKGKQEMEKELKEVTGKEETKTKK